MTEHISSPSHLPLWEEFYSETPEHLFALMADEMWERTGALDHATRIAEAELAHVRAPEDRIGQLHLDDAYHDEASAKAASAILLGFCLGAVARPSLATEADVARWFDRAMAGARLVPLSDEVRAEWRARLHRAMDECTRLRDHAKNEKETTE